MHLNREYLNEDTYENRIGLHGFIQKRGRGVWLAHWSNDDSGEEEWDAFATLPEAKRWISELFGRKNLPWKQDPEFPEEGQAWNADLTLVETCTGTGYTVKVLKQRWEASD